MSDVTDAKILAELLGHQKFDGKVIFQRIFMGSMRVHFGYSNNNGGVWFSLLNDFNLYDFFFTLCGAIIFIYSSDKISFLKNELRGFDEKNADIHFLPPPLHLPHLH